MSLRDRPFQKGAAQSAPATIMIVDDNESVLEALGSLFRSVGYRTELFSSAQDFLNFELPSVPSCLVLDVRLPGINGLDFQLQLKKLNIYLPIIFMTGHGDIPMSVRAMKAGAIDFLTKPFRDQDMLDAVTEAISRDRKRFELAQRSAELASQFGSLTAREREVMALVVKGYLNKQVAAQLGLSEITVKVHRARLMKKLNAGSLADLIQMAST